MSGVQERDHVLEHEANAAQSGVCENQTDVTTQTQSAKRTGTSPLATGIPKSDSGEKTPAEGEANAQSKATGPNVHNTGAVNQRLGRGQNFGNVITSSFVNNNGMQATR